MKKKKSAHKIPVGNITAQLLAHVAWISPALLAARLASSISRSVCWGLHWGMPALRMHYDLPVPNNLQYWQKPSFVSTQWSLEEALAMWRSLGERREERERGGGKRR